jgi:hypothetical protein
MISPTRRPDAALEVRGRRAQHAQHDRDRERAGHEDDVGGPQRARGGGTPCDR